MRSEQRLGHVLNQTHSHNRFNVQSKERNGGGYWSTGKMTKVRKFMRAFPLNFQRALHGSSRIIMPRCNNDKAPIINDYVSCCWFCSTSSSHKVDRLF
jgi:hypothetical protein